MASHNNSAPPKVIFSWQEIEHDTIALVDKLKAKGISYKGIVIVSRGGLAIAALVSRLLDVKLLDIMCVASYDHHSSAKKELEILKNPELAQKDEGKGWLVVDDLIDSGDTYQYIKTILPRANFVCLYNKTNQEDFVKDILFVKNYSKDSWIEFPWETILDN